MSAPLTPQDFAGPRKAGMFERIAVAVTEARDGSTAVLFDAMREAGLELDPTRLHNLDVERLVLPAGWHAAWWYIPWHRITPGQHAAANALLMLAALEGGGRELWRWLIWAHAVSGQGSVIKGGPGGNYEARRHTQRASEKLLSIMRQLDEALGGKGFTDSQRGLPSYVIEK